MSVSVPNDFTKSITKKKDGYLMTRDDASIRYLSFLEGLKFKILGITPKDY